MNLVIRVPLLHVLFGGMALAQTPLAGLSTTFDGSKVYFVTSQIQVGSEQPEGLKLFQLV